MRCYDDTIYNENYIMIISKDNQKYIESLKYMFKNIILFDSIFDLDDIIKFINVNNFTQIIFVDYIPEFFEIIKSLKNNNIIKFVITSYIGSFHNLIDFENFKSIIKLYNENKVSDIGVIDKNMYETLKHNNISCKYLKFDIERSIINKNYDNKHIGILSSDADVCHSTYNSICALKFNDYTAKLRKANKITKKFLKDYNINFKLCKNDYNLYNNNLVNLYINFSNNDNLIFLRSMDMGIPCILGNSDILDKNKYLKSMLIMNSDDNIDEISNRIELVKAHRDKILNEYNKFRLNYINESKESIDLFLDRNKMKYYNKFDKDELLLSIIVPVYNTENYLDKCLKSIIKAIPYKIRNKCEIIVINDGSPDNSEYIIKKYLKKYPYLFKYIKQKNKGLGNVRNVGLVNAKGKYIASIDSDDTIDKKFFKDAYNYLLLDYDLVLFDWLTISEDGKYSTPAIEWCLRDLNKYKGILYTTIMPSSCNKIIKKSLYNDLKIKFYEDKYEDLSTNPFVLLLCNKIKYIQKPLYHYYIRSGSIMHSNIGYSMINVLVEVNNRITKYKDIFSVDLDEFKYYLFSWRIEEFIINQFYNNLNDSKKLINYIYKNIYNLLIEIFNNKYYLKMLDNLDNDFKKYIIKRNKYFKEKKLDVFIEKYLDKRYILNAYIILYGKK